MRKRLFQFLNVSILKTLYFNFKCLPFSQSIKIPVIVYRKTEIVSLKGTIKIKGKVKTGMIQFNNINDEFIGSHYWRRIEIHGEVIFNGKIDFGAGSVLFVRKCGKIEFGNNIIIGGKTKILCEENIKIGNNVRIAHESQIMDTNFHYLRSINDGNVEKCTKLVIIGSNNWIGNRTSIMKGTKTPDFLVVGSNSLLNKDYTNLKIYSIIAGVPAKLLSEGFERIFDLNEEKIYNEKFNRIL